MKKFSFVLVFVIMLMSVFTMTACGDNDEILYDAGEYGELTYTLEGSVDGLKAKEGYRFLGWSEPVKEGKKTVKKAQYEHIEFYLSEVKDVYIFEQGIQKGPSIISRITNLQTNEKTETPVNLHTNAEIKFYGNDSIEYEYNPIITGMDFDKFCANIQPYEFDVIEEVTIDYPEYNIVANFELHFVRNRIPAESMSVDVWTKEGNNVVSKGEYCRIIATTNPDNTSYTECEYRLLTISRNGFDIDKDLINEIAFFNDYLLYVTDKAESGDLIYIQVINMRDPEVKSDIIEITVY